MAELPEALERRVGPFPVVGWLGLIGGGVVMGLIVRTVLNRRGGASGSDDNTLPELDEVGSPVAGAVASTSASSGMPAYYTPAPSATQPTGPGAPANNTEWSTRAIRYLIDAGHDAASAQAAIGKFLVGTPLTSAERSMVSKAIAAVGPTPEYAPPIEPAPDPVPEAPPTPGRTPQYPPAEVSITPPGSLWTHDGNTVFWTDGNAIKHVKTGHESIALWKAGARVAGDVNGEYPIPITVPEAAIRAVPNKVGTPPPQWGAW